MESSPQDDTVRAGPSPSDRPSVCDAALPGFAAMHAANDIHMVQLARTIELEIIPRLMLAHRVATPPAVPQAVAVELTIGMADVERYARCVLAVDEGAAFTAVEAFRARGVPVESIYLDLLAPTARYLGRLWEEDLCTFTDVTVGLGRLQRVLRELSPALGCSVAHPAGGRRVLLLPGPGEQHTFGLVMVAEFFRNAGWDVTGGAWAAGADAAALVAAEWFDAVGFSLGSEIHVAALKASIAKVRHATCNPGLIVLTGGPLFIVDPALAGHVGADGVTIDGREAPVLAERLIAQNAQQHCQRG